MSTSRSPIGAVASGSSQLVGHYHYDSLTEAWEWSDELYLLHGYEPRSVPVTTELFIRHKHPHDRDDAVASIRQALMEGEPFSSYHRIVTRDGGVRQVVAVGAGVLDDKGRVAALDGYLIDVTPEIRRQTHDAAEEAVAAASAHRSVIEQAKGMVMLTYSIDADAAFALLRWWSMECNVKVHLLAERLVATATERQLTDSDAKVRVDHLLHEIATIPDA